MKQPQTMRFKLKLLLWLLISVTLAFLTPKLNLEYFKYSFYDWLMVTYPTKHISDRIVLVQLTDEINEAHGGVVPFEVHEKVFANILAQNPLKLVVHTDIENKFLFRASNKEIASFVQKNTSEKLVFAVNSLFDVSPDESPNVPKEFKDTALEMLPVTQDIHSFSKDSGHRRIILDHNGEDLLLLKLARVISGHKQNGDAFKGAEKNYSTYQTRTRYAPRGTFKLYTYKQIINQDFKTSDLKDKVVFLASGISSVSANYISSPFSTSMKDLSFIMLNEAHAHDLNTLIYNNGVSFQSEWLLFLFLFFVAAISFYSALQARPSQGFVLWSSTILTLFLISIVSFSQFGIFINFVSVLFLGFLSYYILLPLRLVIETKKSEREKVLFARQIGHDIKSPLSALNVLKSSSSMPDRQQNLFNNAVDRVESIADTLLSIDKYFDVSTELTDLDQILVSIVAEKKVEFSQKKSIKLIYNPTKPTFAQANERELKRVISNLINNSFEAIQSEGNINVELTQSGHQIVISIKDNGSGMSAEQLQQIGQPGETTKATGYGLGIRGAKNYLNSIGGALDYESEIGSGTIAKLTLKSSQKIDTN